MGMVTPSRAPRRRERGSALVTALVVLALLGAAFALLAGFLLQRMRSVQNEQRHTELTALVDGAMAETLANLASSPAYPGVKEHDLGDGTIRSEVKHGAGGAFTVEARASVRGVTMAVEAQGTMTATGPRVTSWRRVPTAEAGGGGTVHGGITPSPR